MKSITREMLKVYKPYSHLDWMNYKIVRKEDITFHHIMKRERIEYMLREFERIHRWDKGSKGKLLIKRKYLDRGTF